MPSYHYKALSPQGKIQKGLLEADSERHARQLLREQGMAPLAIKKNQPTLPKSKRVSHRALTLLTRQLATLIAASIPIEEALEGV
ncbi:MAG: type II secretion system protein GspF, partial [Legionellaceae bacterium]|nr:type II secretion system protein GspF [Legionellaceae bacterium]